MDNLIVGITGASGSVYGLRLVEELAHGGRTVSVVATDTGRKVTAHETGRTVEEWLTPLPGVRVEAVDNFFAPIASGSYGAQGMVVAPCSMATLGAVAGGAGRNLLDRAADVMVKERRPLILMVRETPLSAIHLENMLKLARLGVTILPAMPGFYHRPETLADAVDFMVGKALDALAIEHNLYRKWGKEQ